MLISLNQLVTKTKKLNFYVFLFVAIKKEEKPGCHFSFLLVKLFLLSHEMMCFILALASIAPLSIPISGNSFTWGLSLP